MYYYKRSFLDTNNINAKIVGEQILYKVFELEIEYLIPDLISYNNYNYILHKNNMLIIFILKVGM